MTTRQERKEKGIADLESLKTEFRTKMGLGPDDSVDDWIREGLQSLSIVNHRVANGEAFDRCSVFTKARVLREILTEFGVS